MCLIQKKIKLKIMQFVKKGKNNSIVIFNINNLLLNYNKMNTKKNILIH